MLNISDNDLKSLPELCVCAISQGKLAKEVEMNARGVVGTDGQTHGKLPRVLVGN